MAIPHLRTFPELVVFLHNKDQIELFGKIAPDWVRGLMDSLPFVGSNSASCAMEAAAGQVSKAAEFAKACVPWKVQRAWIKGYAPD
jgi:hypothetical protein